MTGNRLIIVRQLLCAAFVCLSCATVEAGSEGEAHKILRPFDGFALGVRSSYNLAVPAPGGGGGAYSYVGSEWMGDVNMTLKVFPPLYLDASAGFLSTGVRYSCGEHDFEMGEIKMMPLTVGILLRESVGRKVMYLSLGTLYFDVVNVEGKDNLKARIDGTVYNIRKIEVEDGKGYYIGTGVDYFLSERLAINFDFRWMVSEKGLKSKMYLDQIGEREMNRIHLLYLIVGAGLKYYLF